MEIFDAHQHIITTYREDADWLEPILELDAAALQAEIQMHKER